MGEMPIYSEERPSAPRMWVTINTPGWWKASCMLKGYMWWKRRMHVYDRCEEMIEDGKGDGEEDGGMPTRSKLTRLEG